MENESVFQKYLLCEQHFGASAKKDVIATVNGYLTSFKKDAIRVIRDRLEHVQRVDDHSEVSDILEKEMERLNLEYIHKLTEFVNTRKFV